MGNIGELFAPWYRGSESMMNLLAPVQLNYRLKRQIETIDSSAATPLTIEIECLENLNETIDQMFELLQKSGHQELLEELCPYFGVIWPSARALARHLVSQASL